MLIQLCLKPLLNILGLYKEYVRKKILWNNTQRTHEAEAFQKPQINIYYKVVVHAMETTMWKKKISHAKPFSIHISLLDVCGHAGVIFWFKVFVIMAT